MGLGREQRREEESEERGGVECRVKREQGWSERERERNTGKDGQNQTSMIQQRQEGVTDITFH